MKPSSNNVPKHIGYIMDGDRTFAKRLMLKPWKGHELGAKKLESLLEWCKEFNIREITLYTFSIENFDRPKKEFDMLMKLFEKEGKALLKDKRPHEQKIKFNFIGRTEMFPDHLQTIMKDVMEMTKNYSDYIVNIAVAYGGRAEIIFLPDVLWPEFNKEHFVSCLEEYSNRKRRYGK